MVLSWLPSKLAVLSAVLFALVPRVNGQTQLYLGMVYIQTGPPSSASWAIESFTQLKLAVDDVNALTGSSAILPAGYVLNYTVYNSQGQSLVALAGAVQTLANPNVVGLVGTGYSSAAAAPATYASMVQMPMISPGATLTDLAVKTNYPYFLRSIGSDASILKGMAVFLYTMNWRRCAVLTNSDFNIGMSQSLLPALGAVSVQTLSLIYDTFSVPSGTPIPNSAVEKISSTMKLVQGSGHRVILLYGKTVDVPYLLTYANASGLFATGYSWVVSQNVDTVPFRVIPRVVHAQVDTGPANPLSTAFATRWANIARTYNCNTDPAFDSTTGYPFWGNNTYTPGLYWDTDYACVGDKLPDLYGTYCYDVVFIYARAIAATIAGGVNPLIGLTRNPAWGPALKANLMATNYNGITGNTVFDKVTQDRAASLKYVMGGPGATSMQKFAMTTDAMNSALDPGKGPSGGWCTTGPTCFSWFAPFTSAPWFNNENPTDGRAVDPGPSSVFYPTSLDDGTSLQVIVNIRDSFGKIPCSPDCGTNLTAPQWNSSDCVYCRTFLINAQNISVIGVDAILGTPLTPATPLQRTLDVVGGTVTLVLPTGFQGAGNQDRLATLSVTQFGALMEPAANVTLTSRACFPGEYGPGRGLGAGSGCAPCLPGTVAPTRGMLTCNSCPPGQAQSASGKTACTTCTPGFFSPQPASASCTLCQQATYGPAAGMGNCTQCPTGMTTALLGATALSDCICPMGTYLPANAIVTPTLSSSPCAPCPLGMTCNAGADARWFTAGYIGPSVTSAPQVNPGFWTPSDNPLSVYKCKGGAAQCLGGPPNTCGANMGGITCAKCNDGYYRSSGLCNVCPDQSISKLLFPTIPILIVLVVVYPFYVSSLDKHGASGWNAPEKAVPVLLTLAMGFAQTVALMGKFNLNLPSANKQQSSSWSFVNEPAGLFNPTCAGLGGFQADMAIKLLLPVFFAVVMIVVYFISYGLGMIRKSLQMDRDVTLGCYGAIFFGLFIGVAGVSLDLFKCYAHPNGLQSLVSNPEIICGQSDWSNMVVASAIGAAVYCGGALALFSWTLATAHKQRDNPNFFKRWKFLLQKFTPSRAWWSIVMLIRGILFNCVTVAFVKGTDQIFAMQVILLAYGMGCVRLMPWRHADANDIELLTTCCLMWASTLLFWYAEPDPNDPAVGNMSIAVTIIPLILVGLMGIFKVANMFLVKKGAKALLQSRHSSPIFSHGQTGHALNTRKELISEMLVDMACLGRLSPDKAEDMIMGMPEVDRRIFFGAFEKLKQYLPRNEGSVVMTEQELAEVVISPAVVTVLNANSWRGKSSPNIPRPEALTTAVSPRTSPRSERTVSQEIADPSALPKPMSPSPDGKLSPQKTWIYC